MPSAENEISAIKLFAFPAEIRIIEPVLPYMLEEWISKNIPSMYRIEVQVGITFQDGDRFNSCQVIYSQFGLAIHQNDHQARRRFVEWAQNEIAVVPDFHKRILFSDEAHFWLNGYVNKQNAAFGVKLIHKFNGDRYRAMITNFFIPELNNHDVQELWFQQDGATCHTARATIDLLKDTFGDRLISRFGPVNWPPRSCDLTPLD
ncbi:putative transposable element [Trichonephila clavipes]|nr:putative transposable element [Trichonephila clavipes]